MLSFKHFLYIVLIIALLGGIFLIFSINESRPAFRSRAALSRNGNSSR